MSAVPQGKMPFKQFFPLAARARRQQWPPWARARRSGPRRRVPPNEYFKRSWITAPLIERVVIQDLFRATAPRRLSSLLPLAGKTRLSRAVFPPRLSGSDASRLALTIPPHAGLSEYPPWASYGRHLTVVRKVRSRLPDSPVPRFIVGETTARSGIILSAIRAPKVSGRPGVRSPARRPPDGSGPRVPGAHRRKRRCRGWPAPVGTPPPPRHRGHAQPR